jgi:23S rRNA (pseudouridine1915-N3)-methyltransferase
MRLVVAAAGRWKAGGKSGGKAGPERALFEHYARRITLPFELKEIEEKKRFKPAALKKREGELLLAQAPEGAVIVALDEGGKALSSAAFADKLRGWQMDGVKHVVFMIGGSEGLDEAVKKRADLVIGLGPMTWPHLLVRGMLAEQVYRAQCILSNHPYHRG